MRYLAYIVAVLLLGCSEQADIIQTEESKVVIERIYDESFKFSLLPEIGTDEKVVVGNTAKLLVNIPYLLQSGVFPSELILDQILSKGITDAGMSGGVRWDGYKLKHGDIDLLLQEVLTIEPRLNLVYIEPDEWVKTYDDWNVWVMFIKHEVPWQEHKRLNDIVIAIENEMEIAKQNNDKQAMNELHLSYIEQGSELSDFIMLHLSK